MYWESYSCEIQIDEIIPEEYEDWLAVMLAYEATEEEKNNP